MLLFIQNYDYLDKGIYSPDEEFVDFELKSKISCKRMFFSEIMNLNRLNRSEILSGQNCSKYEHLGFSFFNSSKIEEDSGISEPYCELDILIKPTHWKIINFETMAIIAIISDWNAKEIRDWV